MSLFDYHGRFSRTNEEDEDSPVDHDGLSAASEIGDESSEESADVAASTESNHTDKPKHNSSALKGAHRKVPAHAQIVDDDEVEDSAQGDAVDDVVDDASYEEASEQEEQAPADEDSEEESTPNETADDSRDDSKNSVSQSDEDDETDVSVDASEEASEEASAGKQAKKKKTPATKGKHVATEPANTYALPVNEEDRELSAKRTRSILKGIGIAACSVIIALALVYGVGVVLFMNRILPNTVVNNHDISFYTNDEAIQLLESIENNYAIEAKMGTFSFKVTKDDIGLQVDAPGIIQSIHERYDAFKWPLYIFESSHDTSDDVHVMFNPAGYEQSFLAAVEEYNKSATPPDDAYIYFDENAKRFLVKDEVMGTQIDPELSLAALTGSIQSLQPVLRLTEAELVQPKVWGNDESLIESAKLATALISAKITLMVNDAAVRDIAHEELSKCISINDKAEVSFDEEALKALCSAVAKEFNTIGTERTFTRADGKVVTVQDGTYGWAVDENALKDSLLDAIKTGESASIVVPFETTAEVYSGPGKRDWGNRYIDIDLTEQHVRLYDDAGNVIWETDCITGSPDGYHNTPQGVWKINDMASPSRLVGYENGKRIYESFVTYWMPFIKNSIGLHDATWQPGFGGSMYANGYGSHGCVNLSYDAAQELYGLVQIGDVVVTHF